MNEDFDSIPIKDDKEDKLDTCNRMLAGIKPGWSLSITRLGPEWCAGFLEKVDILDDENINLNEIVERWGGEALRLRLHDETGKFVGGSDVKVRSYPPCFKGVMIEKRKNIGVNLSDHPTIKKAGAPEREPAPPGNNFAAAPPAPAIAPAAQPQGLDIIQLLGILQNTRKSDMSLFQMLMGQNQQPPPPPPPGSVGSMLEIATQFKQLQELFGGANQEPQTDEAGLLGSITEIAKAYASRGQPAQQPAQQTAPQSRQIQSKTRKVPSARIVPPQHKTQVPQAPQAPQAPHTAQGIPDIATGLSELGEDEFMRTFLTSLNRMPQDKSEAIVQRFMSGELPESDEYENEDDELGEDENGNYAEPDEPPRPGSDEPPPTE